ncbi:periplasmic sensor signal transduction histidine kinase [Magnetococcus marinus MC-1]|uniref:histidine kinase n=1 Tax=Magnetococcus marinus (strain ATCC BAA-1437 / JCM 17883 / MC-1) TaxID=156889 RepID=A0LD86_MAGMM|nr:ATP-binding protein [Magnetococcus marinus]ABK45929.1 periplasmic sensor signal transduction histidine kinase [Magnetococcus marinus MC-1]
MRFQMSIQFRISVAVLLGLVLSSLVGGVSLYEMSRIRGQIQEIAKTELPLTEILTQVENLHLQQALLLERAYRYGVSKQPATVSALHNQFAQTAGRMGQLLQEGRALALGAVTTTAATQARQTFQGIAQSLRVLAQNHEQLGQLVMETLVKIHGDAVAQTDHLFQRIESQELALITAQNQLKGQLASMLQESAQYAVYKEEQGIYLIGLLLGISVVVGLLFSWRISKEIIQPLTEAAQIADRISENQLDIETPKGQLPEMKRLFRAMTYMVTALKERQRLEQLLLISEKMSSIGRLTAGIAHEINNPLASASMGVQTLKTLLGESPSLDVSKRIDSIERNLDRAATIAQEMLVFSRSESSSLVPIDLQEQVEGALTLLSHKLKDVTVVQQWQQDMPEVCGDFVRLEQAFMNIMSNALDAMAEGGCMEIVGERDEEGAMVRITDHGQGIAPELLSRVFDPFFTTKEVGLGTGLGLSICYNTILEHRGSIEITSEVGVGSCVTVRLPVRQGDC